VQSSYDGLSTISGSAAFAAARACIHDTDAQTIADMCAATAIAAPGGAEAERGRWLAARLESSGLTARTDEAGNVIALTPAADTAAGDIVVAAHLDTVFTADTDLTLHRDGDHYRAPGISDNARGLAGMLALARALAAAGWPTRAPVAFVGTVGEEGAGDLRGAKHYLAQHAGRTAAFIALDGAGASRIIHAGVGSRRLRVQFRGPGGHSWSDWGAPNAVHAAGRAIAALCALELPAEPRTTLTVARVGGGTSINTIPADAWIELDLRSEQRDPLRDLERRVHDTLRQAATDGSTGDETMTCDSAVIGDRPAGVTAAAHPLVRLAEEATRAIGLVPELTSSSTDANVAMSLDIPAIAIGAGGAAGGTHTTGEWYENADGALGIERALLIVLGAAGLAAGR
jgi:tripeptide aminopeptidase